MFSELTQMHPIIFGVLMVILAIVVGVLSWRRLFAFKDAVTGKAYTDQLFHIYEAIWNGTEADRAAAWFRTAEFLKAWNFPAEMITEAELHQVYTEYQSKRIRRYGVHSNGRFVKITEIKGGS